MFVSGPVYISWFPHSAHPFPLSHPRHNHITVSNPLYLFRVHVEATAVQPVSECNSTCICI